MIVFEDENERHVNAAAAAVWWNYWDHEHLMVVHDGYTDAKILYENETMGALLLTYKLPVFSWMKSHSLNIIIKHTEKVIKAINVGLFGIPVVTTITVTETKIDHCVIKINHKFFLMGWKQLLKPMLVIMVPRWNEKVWLEDLPLKERRTKVLRYGFKDFYGLPKNIEDRKNPGELKFIRIPLSKLREVSVNAWRKFSDLV